MINLKEIKPREYMKGTKAFRYQMYLYAGLVAFGAVVSISTYYLLSDTMKSSMLKQKQQQEENERKHLQLIYEFSEKRSQRLEDPENKIGAA